MKKLKKTMLLLLLAAALLMPRLPVRAAEVTFTSVNNTLLPLSDDTMPILYGGVVYLPYTTFNSLELGTYAVYSPTSQQVTVFTEGTQLIFDLKSGGAVDRDGVSYTESAISLNGRVYLPVSFTSRRFGISYTTIETDFGPILRLKTRSGYDDQTFAAAAAILLQSRLDEYNASLAPPEPEGPAEPEPSGTTEPEPGGETGQGGTETGGTEPTPQPGGQTGSSGGQTRPEQQSGGETGPSQGQTPQDPPTVPDHSDVAVYLSFYGLDAELTPRILDMLDENGAAACFFLSAEDIAAQPDLTRRLCASGHGVGILCTDAPEAEYAEAAALLYEAAHTSVFLLSPLPAAQPAEAEDTEEETEETEEAEKAEESAAEPLPLPAGPAAYLPGKKSCTLSDCRVLLRVAEDRADLPMLTTEETAAGLSSLLRLLTEEKYDIRLLTESRAAALGTVQGGPEHEG